MHGVAYYYILLLHSIEGAPNYFQDYSSSCSTTSDSQLLTMVIYLNIPSLNLSPCSFVIMDSFHHGGGLCGHPRIELNESKQPLPGDGKSRFHRQFGRRSRIELNEIYYYLQYLLLYTRSQIPNFFSTNCQLSTVNNCQLSTLTSHSSQHKSILHVTADIFSQQP